MIEIKIRNNIEYKYNTETKLYLNEDTNKWVKNPRLQKGKFKGLNKGKLIGKSKNKNYINEYNKLKQLYPNDISFQLIVPKNLTDEEIIKALQIYKDSNEKCKDFKFDIDYAKGILTKLIIEHASLKYKQKRNFKYNQISYNNWIEWLGSNYKFYLDAMIYSDIIECDNKYYNYENNHKAFGFKINGKYFNNINQTQFYRYCDLNNWHLKVKMIKLKINNRIKNRNTLPPYLVKMMNHIEVLFNNIQLDKVHEYYQEHIFEFYEIFNSTIKGKIGALLRLKNSTKFLYLSEYFLYFKTIKDYGFYFNPKDDFGERFHSIFTNIKSVFRKWINFDNELYIECDIVNSQMSFFSLMFKYSNEIKTILPEYSHYLDILHEQYICSHSDFNDVRLFVEKSLKGELYEWIGKNINRNRNYSKKLMFKILFSTKDKFKTSRKQIANILPNIVTICEEFNKNKMIPKLCQLLESRIMIHGVGKELTEQSINPFYTVHDSFGIHPNNLELFISIFNNAFNKLNIEPLKLKFKNYDRKYLDVQRNITYSDI